MGDFILSCATVQNAAFVLRTGANICLQKGFNYNSSVSRCPHQQHDILGVVNLKARLAVSSPTSECLGARLVILMSHLGLGNREWVVLVIVQAGQIPWMMC